VSEDAILWLFGVLIAALFGIVGFLGRIFWAKLVAVDSGALAAFLARDSEREKQWMFWRIEVDKRLDAHAELSRSNADRLTRIERNGH
jgi:hypothetical protein